MLEQKINSFSVSLLLCFVLLSFCLWDWTTSQDFWYTIFYLSAHRTWSSWCGDLGTCTVQWLHEVIKPWLLHSLLCSDRCWSCCHNHWFHWLLWSSKRTYLHAENSKRLFLYVVIYYFICPKWIFFHSSFNQIGYGSLVHFC